MKRISACLLLLLLLAGATPGHAQSPVVEEDLISLDFEDAELADVIKLIAEKTGRNFLFDDRVRGRVTVISPTRITPEEAYRVFESILRVKGFTTVEGPGGVIRIVQIRDAKESPIETQQGAQNLENRDLFITRLIPLRFVKAETISTIFRPLVSKEANLIAYAPTNTLILTDSSSNMRRLMTIIDSVDIETYQEQIKVIPIEFADAAQLAGHLQQIYSTQQIGPRPRARAARARTQRGTAAAVVPAAASVTVGLPGEPRIITDERTNSIIVLAPLATLRQVSKVVSLLDYKRKGTGRIHVYRLQNADAEEMAQTLSSLTQGAPAAGRVPGRPAAAAAAAVARLEGGVRVTADAPTNSLIIQASAEGYGALREVIEALDVRRPQVMVEALILEVAVTDNAALGVDFLFQSIFDDPTDARTVTSSTTGGSPFVTGTISEQLFDANGFGAVAKGFTSAILGKTVTVNGIDVPVIQAILTATADDTNTNIISAPILLTADNEEAQIVIGQNIPLPTSRLQTVDPSAAGGFQTSQNIERQDVGVTLRVTPQISEGDTVRLDIFQEISEVLASSSTLGPTTTQRTVENTVYVRDGEAVMIGGIISENQTETETKVPFLGDIPILGWLFKSVSDSSRKVNLLVILTPHIVRDPGDLEQLTVAQREKFRHTAGSSLDLSDEQLERRKKAIDAGIPLPIDPNPVRRELEVLEQSSPVEKLPELQEQARQREEERRHEMALLSEDEPGSFLVQVSIFREVDEAVSQLKSLIKLGYDGTVLSRSERDSTVHLVQLGPYRSEEAAQRVAREIRAETELSAVVIVEP